jgi:L-arabinonolactonase
MTPDNRGVEIEAIDCEPDKLGEGPLWDPRERVLWWVDILGQRVRRLDPATGAVRAWPVPDLVGCMALREAGGAVLALKSGFHFLDPGSGAVTPVVDPEPGLEGNRFNDGKVDRQGRFLAGTMNMNGIRDGLGTGALYRLNPDRTVDVLRRGMVLTNGPCFSPDGRTFYLTDTARRVIWAFDYDPAPGGALANERVFVDCAAIDAVPDGATVDAEGCLWSTLVKPGQVGRFSPDGELVRTVDLPVDHPSSVMFGGPDLDVLYLTSIREARFFRSDHPGAGRLYAIRGLGVRGLPEPRFKG